MSTTILGVYLAVYFTVICVLGCRMVLAFMKGYEEKLPYPEQVNNRLLAWFLVFAFFLVLFAGAGFIADHQKELHMTWAFWSG